ncbi:heavy metal-associated isoprenylated plant protein 6-like, partial [Phalaenopsis equestris]|uniref:heavy metal-associated isoprenylated plant protein 6-like n=1 Tax=Phalaenopsis equestris TaxID=78828 RepID=UPI0009E646B1
MHCEGCARGIKHSVKGFPGLEGVKVEKERNELHVLGKVDPQELRNHVMAKTHKLVEIASSGRAPKRTGASSSNRKEFAASTAVLKITTMDCYGCAQRVKQALRQYKGVYQVSVDADAELASVTGTMDVDSLPAYLKHKHQINAEIVQ